MLRTKVVAYDVQNLSDARYFAAAGVDWMTFDITESMRDKQKLEAYKQMIDWVSGVQFGFHIPSTINETELTDIRSVVSPDRWVIDAFTMDRSIFKLPCIVRWQKDRALAIESDDIVIIKSEDPKTIVDDIKNISSLSKELYVMGDYSMTDMDALITQHPEVGVVLKGGDEEKVGLKSFEELDALIEMLEI